MTPTSKQQVETDSVEKILSDAREAKSFKDGWVLYERFKQRLQDLNLECREYENAIARLAQILQV